MLGGVEKQTKRNINATFEAYSEFVVALKNDHINLKKLLTNATDEDRNELYSEVISNNKSAEVKLWFIKVVFDVSFFDLSDIV